MVRSACPWLLGATLACAVDATPEVAATTTSSGESTGAAGSVDTTITSDGLVTTETGAPTTADTTASTDGTSGETTVSGDDTTTGELPGFEPQPCLDASPDVAVHRLCDEGYDPASATDEIAIHCELESGCAGGPPGQDVQSLRVFAWNIARGGSIDAQIAAFASGELPMPDVLLLGEVDRGCSRTGTRNIAWEYAVALGMHHVYGVEFIELPRADGSIAAPCEHGNAILSRYPLGNVALVRHADNESWFDTPETRLGGRMAVVADLDLGDRLVTVSVVHFESGARDVLRRAAQAAEIADFVADDRPVVIGGDTNAGLYAVDLALGTHTEPTTEAFFDRGFVDAHLALPPLDRTTKPPALVLDLVMLRGGEPSSPVVCDGELCDPLSDHRAVWVDVALPPVRGTR